MRAALVDLIGDRAYADWFVTDNLVRRIVATVDNLPRARMSAQLRPVRSAPGSFVTQGDEAQRSIAASPAAVVELVLDGRGDPDLLVVPPDALDAGGFTQD